MPGTTRPWMDAMEKQLEAFSIIKRVTSLTDPKAARIVAEHGFTVDRVLLGRATPYAWSKETTQAVLEASKSVPLDATFSTWNLNTSAAWWYFEDPLPFATIDSPRVRAGVRALCFGWLNMTERDGELYKFDSTNQTQGIPIVGVSAWCDNLSRDGLFGSVTPSQTWVWVKDQSLGDMLNETKINHVKLYETPGGKYHGRPNIGVDRFLESCDGLSRFILAGMAWLTQRVLVEHDGAVERHRRKDFNKRTGRDLTSVRVVSLRRTERKEEEQPTDEERRKLTVRFVVSGHWRNQACGPRQSERRLLYINPYVKGPDDAPMQAPRPVVYRVDR